MLQRLPTLGRLNTESNDRQFVDVYILDGLRARDVTDVCLQGEAEFAVVASAKWTNPLGDLGQRVLAAEPRLSDQSKKDFAERAQTLGNSVMACDLISSIIRRKAGVFDFDNLHILNGDFRYLDFRDRPIKNLKISDSLVGELSLPAKQVENTFLIGCMASRVTGISSSAALPNWITKFESDTFDSVENVSRVRKIGLKPPHEILIVIIRKTFFQKGAGRKEEALLRGLGSGASRNISRKIVNMLIREDLLTVFRGSEGDVYAPVRAHTRRMQKMLDELSASSDPLWSEVDSM